MMENDVLKGRGLGLVADIGGTNARFALIDSDGTIKHPWRCMVEEYASLAGAIEAYLSQASAERPAQAALAVAAPITGDQVSMTNHPAWSFSIADMRRDLGLRRLRVVNDFTANALAIPHLDEASRLQIGPGAPTPGAPIGLIGPGSGLGVSGLVSTPSGPTPVEGEGGHATMSPTNEIECAVLDLLRKRYGHVSAERVLSGPGLVNLYEALCQLSGVPARPYGAAQVTDPVTWNADACAKDAVAMFCAMLGTVSGNLALTFGARGGVYIAGGIVPKLGARFLQSQFRTRFESKGRFESYLQKIPTYVITHPTLALLGASALLE
jgi:glucokinase